MKADTASVPRGRFDVRRISWPRIVGLIAVAGIFAGAVNYVSENMLVLNADGLVLRDRIAAAAPYEARIKQIVVRSGDYVHEGTTIATLESASMSRSLADLSAQKARLTSSIAHLESRRLATEALLPIAKKNAARLHGFLDELERSRDRSMTSFSYVQQITADAYAAEERLASLQAEQRSADEELRQNRAAFAEMDAAYENVKSLYADGVLVAGASGYVGAVMAEPGEVVVPGGKVLEIYTGRPFVLAYLPDSSVTSIGEGDRVRVRSARRMTHATVQKILPMVEALPPEFQKPVHARESGQLLRISLAEEHGFVTNQKVRINGCYLSDCTTLGDAALTVARMTIARLSDWFSKDYAAIVHQVELHFDTIKAFVTMTTGPIDKASAADQRSALKPEGRAADNSS
jgi:multidrug resistance efflux pump